MAEDVSPVAPSGEFPTASSKRRTRVFPQAVTHVLLGLSALTLVTLVCFRLGFDVTPTAFLYLVVILGLSLVSSFIPLAALSVLAVVSLNYFFVAPRFTFTVEEPQDAVVLGTFLITALVTTRLVSRSTQAARFQEQRARLLDLTHDAVFVRNMDRRIIYWNRAAEELYGWTAAEALGQDAHELLHTRLPVPLADIKAEMLRNGSWQGNIVHTTRDGKPVVVESRWAVERDKSGNPVAFLETTNDITERKRAEDEVRASEARFRTLVDHASDAFFLTDEWGTIIDVNRQACESLGYTRDEIIGRIVRGGNLQNNRDVHQQGLRRESDFDPRFLDINDMSAEDQKRIQERLAKGEMHVTFETRHRRKDGTMFPVEGRLRVFLSEDGRPFVITLVRDITDRKKAEQALREAQAALTQVTRLTTFGEVTASVAHELNQPLGAIVNNANACLGLLPTGHQELDDVRETLGDIVSDAERASAIIERVRGLAKRSAPERVGLRLVDVVADVLALAAAEAAARGVTIQTDVPRDLPVVLGDRVQLQQVLLNLVVNAMDAMGSVDEPERRLQIRGRLDTDGGRRAVTICVEDCGIGLQPEAMHRLFDVFYTTKPHGMGLGLAISRSIIEAHGGRLWAAPNRERGAVFSFWIPAAEATAAA